MKKHKKYYFDYTENNGSVFILVLWTLFFLGALAMAVATIVSSGINLSSQIKARETARMLARGGVDFAITEVMGAITNWEVKSEDKLKSDASLFQDNDKLKGGTFSIYYEYAPEDSGIVATNYGVLDEGTKANINRMGTGKMENLFDEISEKADIRINSGALAKEIYDSRHLTDKGKSSYSTGSDGSYHCYGKNGKGKFELLQELLLLKPFENNVELFTKLEPYLTVYPKDSFKATAVGRALGKSDNGNKQEKVLAEAKIDFVFNGKSGKIMYWHEY